MKIQEIWYDGDCRFCGSKVMETFAGTTQLKYGKTVQYKNACSNELCKENYWHYIDDRNYFSDYYKHLRGKRNHYENSNISESDIAIWKRAQSETIRNKYGKCDFIVENNEAHIFGLYIKPAFRGAGHARALLQIIIKNIKHNGYDILFHGKIKIVADPTEEGIDKNRLKAFYQSLGLDVYDYYG